MTDALSTPGAESKADRSGGPTVPWDRPGGRLLRALWATWWASLRHPLSFFAAVSGNEDRWTALGYALVMDLVGHGLSALSASLISGEVARLELAALALSPVRVLLAVWLGSEMMHGILGVVRSPRKSRAVTHRAIAYCYGPAVLGVIPRLGILSGLVAAALLQVVALRQAHGTTTLRAAVAVAATWGALLGLAWLAVNAGAPASD